MRTIAVALGKGGVGKTTSAVNLAHALAIGGARVLLVDVDSQGHCAASLGVTPSATLADLVDGAAPQDVVIEARPGLWLVAGGRPLAGLRREIDRRDVRSDQVLVEALGRVNGYDLAIMDTAPAWDSLTVCALFAASEVLAPVSMEPLAVTALAEFRRSMAAIQRYHAALRLAYVAPTFVDGRVAKSAEILGQLGRAYGELVTAPIRYSVRLSECAAFGETCFEYDPRGRAAEDYRALSRRVYHATP